MQIVTIISDFGNKDYYAGALKGAILCKSPTINLVDVTHEIEPYNIVQAAFVLKNIYAEFPIGTIHLVAVNCTYDKVYEFVCLRHEDHYFIAPDNGVLSLVFKNTKPENLVKINNEDKGHFLVKNIFSNTVAQIMQGVSFEEMGKIGDTLVERITLQPVFTPTRIRGTVIYIDNFENVILNITKEIFEKGRNGRAFSLFFKRNDPITFIGENYFDVQVGETLCLFNAAGYLEIAINMGKAASLLGLKVEDVVEIIFD
jgi:S-adenosyl-L-methionine hydrolase (adenosine-forming)